jgi:hypothetical protein
VTCKMVSVRAHTEYLHMTETLTVFRNFLLKLITSLLTHDEDDTSYRWRGHVAITLLLSLRLMK